MRLSTEPDRDEAKAIEVLHAAFDAGVTLLDTADAYCWNDSDTGHNERLIARALAGWTGPPSLARTGSGYGEAGSRRITVATKGGITRPDGRWQTDGRAKHLAAACEASCRALDVSRIDLYQLHAPDPRTPLATSVRALARLQRDGLIKAIGLCNVTVGQIEEARRIAEIESIQVEASRWHDAALLGGVAEYCDANRLRLLAYRPLGGRKARARTLADPVLNEVAARHHATPFEIALAWLAGQSPMIVPLPGVTRVETAQSAVRASRIQLTAEDQRALETRVPARTSGAVLRHDAEVVLVMGLPGAGKSKLAQTLVAEGYQRLNRDEAGGSLRDLMPALDRALAAGGSRLVLDNTYMSRQSRAEVIRAAAAQGVPVRCVWLSTSVDEAQVNVAWRLVSRYGRLPDAPPFLPNVLFRYQRELEPPDPAEGFSRIDIVPFERRLDPAHSNRAAIVWCDDVLMRSQSGHRTPSNPDDVVIVEECAAILREYQDAGWRVLGMSWQPEIEAGTRSAADAAAVFARMNLLARLAVEVEYCPHAAGPPRCWCRKPLPGLGVLFIHRHQLDPARCVYLGGGPQDPGFARKLGLTCRDAPVR